MGESQQSRNANRNKDLHGFADFNCRFWQAYKPGLGATGHFLVQFKHLTQVPVSLYAMRHEPLVWASTTSV